MITKKTKRGEGDVRGGCDIQYNRYRHLSLNKKEGK